MPLLNLPVGLFLAFIIGQRLVELVIARRNTLRLLARGGYEVGASHYPLIVLLHVGWIIAMVIFGWQAQIVLGWLLVYAVLQALRVYILKSLGQRWTTRIIILGEPPVQHGPYRFFPHPNYALVVAEVFVAPMVLGLVWVAIAFSILNAAMLALRISVENKALASARQKGARLPKKS